MELQQLQFLQYLNTFHEIASMTLTGIAPLKNMVELPFSKVK